MCPCRQQGLSPPGWLAICQDPEGKYRLLFEHKTARAWLEKQSLTVTPDCKDKTLGLLVGRKRRKVPLCMAEYTYTATTEKTTEGCRFYTTKDNSKDVRTIADLISGSDNNSQARVCWCAPNANRSGNQRCKCMKSPLSLTDAAKAVKKLMQQSE